MDIKELKNLLGDSKEIEINNFELEAEELTLELLPQIISEAIPKKLEIKPFQFSPPSETYPGKISEVTLGATRAEGGTRSHSVTIGGETTPPFYFFEGEPANKPVISHDVFDMPISLPGHVREYFPDVMEDPAEWARCRVKKYNAGMITLHMVSTDPNVKDTSVKDACKIIEDVLQAVKVPLVIGGSGNPKKDPELLEKAAEICAGERVLLSTVDPDMDYTRVAKAALKYDHSVLSLISMNPDEMRRLNRNLMKEGLDPEHMLMDLFTGGIGYGLEYSISAMERCRLAGLKGDKTLGLPIVSATSNSWSAREAWMRNDAWGPREWRGPLWESTTAIIALLSGANLFLMLHPLSIEILEKIIDSLFMFKDIDKDEVESKYPEWINLEQKLPELGYTEENLRKRELNERQIKAVLYVKERKEITHSIYKSLVVDVTNKTMYRDLQDIVDKGLFRQIGEKKGRRYELI